MKKNPVNLIKISPYRHIHSSDFRQLYVESYDGTYCHENAAFQDISFRVILKVEHEKKSKTRKT